MQRLRDFISYPSHSRTMGILAFLILVLAIPLTVNIAQKQQELRQRAEGNCPTITNELGLPECVTCACDTPEGTAPNNHFTCTDPTKSAYCAVNEKCVGSSTLPNFPCQAITSEATAPAPVVNTCAQNGNDCVGTPDACDRIGVPGNGTCPPGGPGICCKVGGSGGIPACGTGSTAGATCVAHDKCGVDIGGTLVNGNCGTSGQECCLTTVGPDADAVCNSQGGYCFNGICANDNATSAGTCTRGLSCCKKNAGGGGTACNSAANHFCYQSLDACVSDIGTSRCKLVSSESCTNGYSCFDTTGSAACDTSNQNDGWTFKCGPSQTGGKCQVGEHQSVCTRNPSQNTDNCWPDSSFLGINPCAGVGGTPSSPGASPGAPASPPSSPPASPAPVACTVINENLSGACQVAANTCSSSTTGTRTVVKDSGSANCKSVTLTSQPCTSPVIVINNCASGNVCPAGGTGVCVQNTSQNGNTQLVFVLGLHGIGSFGDSKNANSSGSNKNPKRTTRSLGVELFDPNNTGNKLFSITGNLAYDSNSGTFSSTVTLPNTFQTGNYLVKIKPDGYLRATVKGSGGADTNFQTGNTNGVWNIVAGKKNTLGLTSVIAVNGDISGTNHLIDSYNKLLGCMFKSANGDCQAADLNDDGQVNQFDYNLYLREISVVQDGD